MDLPQLKDAENRLDAAPEEPQAIAGNAEVDPAAQEAVAPNTAQETTSVADAVVPEDTARKPSKLRGEAAKPTRTDPAPAPLSEPDAPTSDASESKSGASVGKEAEPEVGWYQTAPPAL